MRAGYYWSLFLVEGAYPWGLIKHDESPRCLISWGERDVLKRLGEFCGPVHLLPGTYIHLVAASRLQAEVLGKISFRNGGLQIGFAWEESAPELLPGGVFKLWESRGDYEWCGVMSTCAAQPDAPAPENGPQAALTQNHTGCLWIWGHQAPAQTYGIRILGDGPCESIVWNSSGWLWEVWSLRLQALKYWPFQFQLPNKWWSETVLSIRMTTDWGWP